MSAPNPPRIVFGLNERETAATRWLWHGILAPGKLTLLTSLWKSGKTTLLTHLLARRTHGGDFLGLPVSGGASLIVSEESRDLWPERFRRHGLGREVAVLSRPFTGRPTFAQLDARGREIARLKAAGYDNDSSAAGCGRPGLVVTDARNAASCGALGISARPGFSQTAVATTSYYPGNRHRTRPCGRT